MISGQGRGRGTARRATAVAMATALVTVVLAWAAPLAAQTPEGRRGPPQDRAEMERRVRAQMARIVQERLELSDDESRSLGEVMQRFEGRRREIRRSEMATRRRVEALVLEGGEDPQEAEELLGRLADLRSQESALFEEEQAALLEVLSPVQVLKLQALREEMGRRIRALRGGEPGGRRRGPGGSPPGNVDAWFGVPLSR